MPGAHQAKEVAGKGGREQLVHFVHEPHQRRVRRVQQLAQKVFHVQVRPEDLVPLGGEVILEAELAGEGGGQQLVERFI